MKHRMSGSTGGLFTGVRGETVWKIAENVSARLSGGKKRPNWDSFHPSWPLSEPRFETYPEFPNSFGSGILRTSPLRSSRKYACPGPVLIIHTGTHYGLSWSRPSGERIRVPQDLARSASKC